MFFAVFFVARLFRRRFLEQKNVWCCDYGLPWSFLSRFFCNFAPVFVKPMFYG